MKLRSSLQSDYPSLSLSLSPPCLPDPVNSILRPSCCHPHITSFIVINCCTVLGIEKRKKNLAVCLAANNRVPRYPNTSRGLPRFGAGILLSATWKCWESNQGELWHASCCLAMETYALPCWHKQP